MSILTVRCTIPPEGTDQRALALRALAKLRPQAINAGRTTATVTFDTCYPRTTLTQIETATHGHGINIAHADIKEEATV